MEVSLVGKSDYRALAAGNPNRLKLVFSDDVSKTIRRLPKCGPDEPRRVLLLGATGFVGMHILNELVADPRVEKVHVLVRRSGGTSPSERIELGLRKYGMSLENPHKIEI